MSDPHSRDPHAEPDAHDAGDSADAQAYSEYPDDADGYDDPDDYGPEPADRQSWKSHLAASPVRLVLAAIVVGAVVAGCIVAALGGFGDKGDVATSSIGESQRGPDKNAFNQSVPGDCLTWPADNPGKPSKVDCAQQHYFEVAGVIDTSAYPGTEFSSNAPWPGTDWFSTFRDEHCPTAVSAYLGGKLDPQGRFSVGLMYPSAEQWSDGERALRCGLQLSDSQGRLQPFLGKVGSQDQSLQWPAGTCIGINAQRQPTDAVACSEPHAFQVTAVVDLSGTFGAANSGAPAPSVDKQNAQLTKICPDLTDTFFGGDAKFAKTTLNVQWSTIAEPSWAAGSRKVVCYVGLPDAGGFATLVGDARQTLLINGKIPNPPPAQPPGRILPTAVPLPGGVEPNPTEMPAPNPVG